MATGTEIGASRFGHVDWRAIAAGLVLALATHIVLGLFGAAMGFGANPADSEGLGWGAAVWAVLTPFVASVVGAFVAVRHAGVRDARSANLNGLLVWGLGLIAGALFLTGAFGSGAITLGPDANVPVERAARAAAATSAAAAIGAIFGLLGALAGSALGRGAGERRRVLPRIRIERGEHRAMGADMGPTASRPPLGMGDTRTTGYGAFTGREDVNTRSTYAGDDTSRAPSPRDDASRGPDSGLH